MISEIILALKFLEKSENCRILVISGEGNTFSSGADLEWMKKSINLKYKENVKESKEFTKMLKSIDSFSKPTISLVNGHAFGGALGIIAATDFAISFKESKFCFSEVRLGLIPAMIAPYILRSIGYKETKKLFLTGEVFTAQKAVNIGLIDETISLKDFNIKETKLIKDLLIAAPIAQKKIKLYLKKIFQKEINAKLINDTATTISKIRVTEEAQKGLRAFFDKKEASWSNKNDS